MAMAFGKIVTCIYFSSSDLFKGSNLHSECSGNINDLNSGNLDNLYKYVLTIFCSIKQLKFR